jgi:hypothetical protein
MRSILAALNLARDTDRKLIVVWERKKELNAPFSALFQPSDAFKVIETSALILPSLYEKVRQNHFYSFRPEGKVWLKANQNKPYQEGVFNDDFAKIAQNIHQNNDFEHFKFFKESFIKEVKVQWQSTLKAPKDLYISSFYEFYEGNAEASIFKPTLELQSQINQFTKDFDVHTYGLHIRRGDHKMAIERSPLSKFITIIEQEITKNKELKFFLATDDASVEQKLKAKFSEKIITKPKNLSRNSTRGIQDAVLDLYILAKTQKVYGSYWSSFSEMAARLSGIEEVSVI